MKILIRVLFLFALPLAIQARQSKNWHYQEMVDKADLVVIAKPNDTKDTAEKFVLTDIAPHLPVIGVETNFNVTSVLKGNKDLTVLLLHHYRLADLKTLMMDGPALCHFEHGWERSFLLFLVREPDGRYAPVNGQTDPENTSVIQLPGLSR